MGHAEFLVGKSGGHYKSVREAIYELEDLSLTFMRRWSQGDMEQAGVASGKAMKCFDYIVGELLRARDDKKTASAYNGSSFEAEMTKHVALMVKPAQRQIKLKSVQQVPARAGFRSARVHQSQSIWRRH